MQNIFFSRKEGKYYCCEDVLCAECSQVICDVALILLVQKGKVCSPLFFCHKHFGKARFDRVENVAKNFVCLVGRECLPKDAVLVLDLRIDFSFGKLRELEGFLKRECVKTIDKTRYAGSESWEGAKIGVKIGKDEVVSDVDRFFLDVKRAEVLDGPKILLLENDGGEK